MYLDQLAYFAEIINCGSISAAAKKLFISQPALSQSIANLENELGAKLINRSSLGIKPTMLGTQIYLESAEILAKLDSALSRWKDVSARSREQTGTATVCCTPTTNDFFSTVIMEEMQVSYPNVVLSVRPSMSMYFVFNSFEENNTSIGIGSSLSGLIPTLEKESEDRGFCFEVFSTEQPGVVLNKRNSLSSHEFLLPEELKALKIAIFSDTPPAPFVDYFGSISCRMASEESLISFVASNPSSATLLVPTTGKKKLVGKHRSLSFVPIKNDDNLIAFEPVSHFLVHKKPELLTSAELCAIEVIKYCLKSF